MYKCFILAIFQVYFLVEGNSINGTVGSTKVIDPTNTTVAPFLDQNETIENEDRTSTGYPKDEDENPEFKDHFKRGQFLFPSERYQSMENTNLCSRASKCEKLQDMECLGAKLPYSSTSMELSMLPNQRAAKDVLEKLKQKLINIPRCWAVIQPFLCSVLFPSCNNNTVQLPSKEMCLITKSPCKIVQQEESWPEFLNCKDSFASNCQTASHGLAYNTTGRCSLPLVATTKEERWYPGIRGCGVQCSYPMFTPDEGKDIKSFIKLFGGLSVAFSLFTVLTFIIDWKDAYKYPAKIVFYINACFLVASSAFMFQFQATSVDSIPCHTDGTPRKAEPSSGDNMTCMIVFVLVYYCMISAGMWFVILGYSLLKSFKSRVVRQCRLELEQQGSYFHLISWSLPLIFSITILALAEVDGDSVSGICFLSDALYVRVIFLLVPFSLFVTLGNAFLIKGIIILMGLRNHSTSITNAKKTMVQTIIRLLGFCTCLTVFIGVSIYFHVYYYTHFDDWQESLREYILCTSKITEPKEYGADCKMEKRPSINVYKLHLFVLFGSGIAFSSWCWTSNSVEAWQRFFQRLCGLTREDQRRINRATKRNHSERFSIAANSLPAHPMGNILNFHMNSGISSDMSLWGTAMHNFNDHAVFGINKRVSIDRKARCGRLARRHSLDSQMSFHVSDVERTVALQTVSHFRGRRKHKAWLSHRKGSNTSEDSNIGSCSGILPSFVPSNQDSLFTKTMKIVNNGHQRPLCIEQGNGESSGDLARRNTRKDQFSRRFGAQRNVRSKSGPTRSSQPEVIKASVAVQTSLESLDVKKLPTEDRACQFPSPSAARRDIWNSSVLDSMADSFPTASSLVYENTLAEMALNQPEDKYFQPINLFDENNKL